MKPVLRQFVAGLSLGLAGVALVTFTFFRLIPANPSTAGFFYLLVVLAVATASGLRVSIGVSLVAMLCFNYFFLPPVGQFTIADPENWAALFTFLLTALVASHLSNRARTEAAEARRRQQETEQLYSLSRSILLTDFSRPVGTQAARSIAQIFDSPTVMILDGKTGLSFQGGARDIPGLESRLQEVLVLGSHQRDEKAGIDLWPIALGGSPMGALAASGITLSDGAVQSMLNLVAIALERVRTEEAANRAEVARQSEEFKSTLLDAIAHEFKTPLTSIKAAVTALRAKGPELQPDDQELAEIIEEETDRMSRLVTEAVKMAEIDAGKVTLLRSRISAVELVQKAIDGFQSRGAERIHIAPPDAAESVWVDAELMTLALRQVMDNALKYSPPGSMVNCEIARDGERVVVRVRDQGIGIPERDRERVFDKFYRRSGVRDKVPGSGLGLHIAREITRIHGGDLWAGASASPGAVFCFGLPAGEVGE